MKKVLLLCLVSLFAIQASAQYYGHSGYGHGFNRTSSGEYLSAGYRGMVEFANGACFGGDFSTLFSTTHGYQFNQHIYLGAFWGLGLGCCGDAFITDLGVDFRAYFLKTRITPYLGARVGYTYCDECESLPYIGSDLGVRFGLKNKLGLIFAINIDSNIDCDTYARVKLGFEF
jgi:hypothetical protein